MLTGEAPTMNRWYNKERRKRGNEFQGKIPFKNDKLLTEPPKPFLTISVAELYNLLLYLHFISFQHFKYIFQKINTKFQIIYLQLYHVLFLFQDGKLALYAYMYICAAL